MFCPGKRKVADPSVERHLLQTAALIAYHQPLLQSELVSMVGARAYDHVKELSDLGLVQSRREGRSYALSTTKEFPRAFGLSGQTNDSLRAELSRMLESKRADVD